MKELEKYILEERIEEEKVYLAILKHMRKNPNNRKNTDSAIKQIEKALLKLDFY